MRLMVLLSVDSASELSTPRCKGGGSEQRRERSCCFRFVGRGERSIEGRMELDAGWPKFAVVARPSCIGGGCL